MNDRIKTAHCIDNLRKRSVSISYNKSKVYENIQYTFTASIMRLSGLDRAKDFFSLWIYLDSIGADFPTKLVGHYSEKDADIILREIADAIKTHAKQFIEGSEWKEGFDPKW